MDVGQLHAGQGIGARRWASRALPFLPAVVLFLLGGFTQMDVPGLYMDAVNPDYLVVKLLGQGANWPVWTVPGFLVAGRFPILGQIYHGALTYWVGLPSYMLFGTGVFGVRITNILFGLLVLGTAGLFMRVFGARPWTTALALAALALDPGFLFTWRVQFYINVLPLAAILASIAWVESRRDSPSRPHALACGLLAGVSVYGYFIYLFLLPAAVLHAGLRWRRDPGVRALAVTWLLGFALGVSPYALGLLGALVAAGGPSAFVAMLSANVGALGVAQSALGLGGRWFYLLDLVGWTVQDVGPSVMMTGTILPPVFPGARMFLLLALPAAGAVAALAWPGRRAGLLVCAGLAAGIPMLVLVFGNRLWLHHTAMLLPILYAGLALSLQWAGTGRAGAVLATLVLAPLLAGNAVDRQAVFFELERTGGTGLSSDAIVRFAQDAARTPAPTTAFTPDWGVSMPFTMVTRGRVASENTFAPGAAKAVLCAGRDALLAVMAANDPARLPPWIEAVGGPSPERTEYRQRDGVLVLTALRWRAAGRPCTN